MVRPEVRNALLYLVLRVGAWVVPRLPLGAAYALASLAGSVAFVLARPAREAIMANLSIAFPELPATLRRRLALAAFRHDAMNWIDTLRIPALRRDQMSTVVDVDHWEFIDDAMAAGKGLILTFLHVGNFDLVGHALIARGLPFSTTVEHMQPERLYRFLVDQRTAQGIRLFPVEHAPREIIRALRHGELVGIAADRSPAGRGIDVEFFGRRCQFPRGPAALARRTGVPLLVGVGIRRPGRAFQGYVVPVDVPQTHDVRADEAVTVQRLATIAQSFVRAYPGQWMAFSPIFPDSRTAPNDPATISQQSDAGR